jgi:hypothetical protein
VPANALEKEIQVRYRESLFTHDFLATLGLHCLKCIASAMHGPEMKTTTIPPIRVSQDLRKQAEAVLEEGETISGFMLESLNRNIEYRKVRREFVARGLASAARAKKTGKYVSAGKVIAKLGRKLDKAKRRSDPVG